jgi:SPP1 gp7 family putative phage head morphogenesis protein
VAHVILKHFAKTDPRSARLKKRRDRKLKPIRPSRKNELWYHAKLAEIVDHLRRAGTAIAESLKNEWAVPDIKTGDSRRAFDVLSTITDEVTRRPTAHDVDSPPGLPRAMQIANGKFAGIKAVAKRLAKLAVDQNLAEVDDRVAASIKASVGVDLRAALTEHGPIATEMRLATADNVDLITSIPDQYLGRVRDAVVDSWNKGQAWDVLAERIQEIGDVTDRRAELIARDQTGKMNSTFNQVRQTTLGVDKYEWQTAGDERVRTSHRAMNGKTFEWSDPPVVDGERTHPGQAIQCRCVAAPVVDLDEVDAAAEEVQSEAA